MNPDAFIHEENFLVAQMLKSGRNLSQNHVMGTIGTLSLMSRVQVQVCVCVCYSLRRQPSDSDQVLLGGKPGGNCQINLQMR